MRPSPRNPRHQTVGIDELADSISTHGLLQPVVVRIVAGGYELIAGHRRLAAVQRLGWSKVPAVVREEDQVDAYILTLVENLQREDLSPREEAEALEVLVRERGWSTRQVGAAVNKSAMYVSKRLRVFEDQVLATPVLANQLPVSTAEELLRVPDEERRAFVEQAVAERWGQADARRAVQDRKVTLRSGVPPTRLASHIRTLTEELTGLEPGSLPPRARRDAAHLLEVLARITRLG